jgi:diaminopimelate epimerase
MFKCNANGNTFLIIEDIECANNPKNWFTNNKCSEDGVIWLSQKNDMWQMEYFNHDGSSAAMCGNGARSAFFYLHKIHNLSKNVWHTLLTSSGEVKGKIDSEGYPIVSMPEPIFISQVVFKNSFVNHLQVGVHHVVRQVKTIELLESFELESFFTEIRNSGLIPPMANVNVFYYEGNHVWLRTFENGVNRETKSCGTGCTAISYLLNNQLNSPYNEWLIQTKGGEIIVSKDEDLYYLKGRVKFDDII